MGNKQAKTNVDTKVAAVNALTAHPDQHRSTQATAQTPARQQAINSSQAQSSQAAAQAQSVPTPTRPSGQSTRPVPVPTLKVPEAGQSGPESPQGRQQTQQPSSSRRPADSSSAAPAAPRAGAPAPAPSQPLKNKTRTDAQPQYSNAVNSSRRGGDDITAAALAEELFGTSAASPPPSERPQQTLHTAPSIREHRPPPRDLRFEDPESPVKARMNFDFHDSATPQRPAAAGAAGSAQHQTPAAPVPQAPQYSNTRRTNGFDNERFRKFNNAPSTAPAAVSTYSPSQDSFFRVLPSADAPIVRPAKSSSVTAAPASKPVLHRPQSEPAAAAPRVLTANDEDLMEEILSEI